MLNQELVQSQVAVKGQSLLVCGTGQAICLAAILSNYYLMNCKLHAQRAVSTMPRQWHYGATRILFMIYLLRGSATTLLLCFTVGPIPQVTQVEHRLTLHHPWCLCSCRKLKGNS